MSLSIFTLLEVKHSHVHDFTDTTLPVLLFHHINTEEQAAYKLYKQIFKPNAQVFRLHIH